MVYWCYWLTICQEAQVRIQETELSMGNNYVIISLFAGGEGSFWSSNGQGMRSSRAKPSLTI